LESAIEAASHVVRKCYEEENSECLLLVDADNAFNKLNRKVSLENIKGLCPPMYTYLHNSYNTPTMLNLENGDHILSQEGVTQGAMHQWQCTRKIITNEERLTLRSLHSIPLQQVEKWHQNATESTKDWQKK